MTSRLELARGETVTGLVNGKVLAERLGVAHGTVKRWLHEGLPAERVGHKTWIDPKAAVDWIAVRFKGKKTIAFQRRGYVYLAEREDLAIKIGWSSDVMRRVFELRKDTHGAVQLLACFPGDKPDEILLHHRFAGCRLAGEWYQPSESLTEFVTNIRHHVWRGIGEG